jgi:outer membrane protein assembly factor BamB
MKVLIVLTHCRMDCLAFVALLLAGLAAQAADWPRFRGPGGAAVSEDPDTPVSWSDEESVLWKTALPGFGTSSPIVVGDRVLLTCYSGYGLNAENPGREEDLKRQLVCLDRRGGRILWVRDVPAAQPEASYTDFLLLHGYASSTPASDGQRVYACFGKSGTRAYDLEGNELWQLDVGSQAHYWGSAGSPVLYGDMLLVNAAVESQSLFALDKLTGKEVWRVKGLLSSWSTPVLVDLPGGGTELVLSVRSKLVAFDPETGRQKWICKTEQSYASPTPAVRGDVLYAYATNPGQLIAVRAGGEGDVSQSHVAWRARGTGSGITSPLVYGEHVYSIDERGIASCVRAEDGGLVYTRRLGGGDRFYASPIMAGDKLYGVSREQGVFVLAAGPTFKQLAHNRFESDTSVFNATPAVCQGQLFLRSDRFLYCLGRKSESTR